MIYNFISKGDFNSYKRKLIELENKIEPYCLKKGFNIDRDRYYEDTLTININTSIENKYHGNICLQYLDKKGEIKFNFGLIKTYDEGNLRHYLKVDLIQEDKLGFIEENIESLLKLAIDIYRRLTKEDLIYKIEMPPRYT